MSTLPTPQHLETSSTPAPTNCPACGGTEIHVTPFDDMQIAFTCGNYYSFRKREFDGDCKHAYNLAIQLRAELATLTARAEQAESERDAARMQYDVTNAMLAFATQQHEKQENALVNYQVELSQVRDALERQHAATDQIWNQYHVVEAQRDEARAQVRELQARLQKRDGELFDCQSKSEAGYDALVSAAPGPAQGWRLLEVGEVVQVGDEYLEPFKWHWRPVRDSWPGNQVVSSIVRRRIAAPAPPAQALPGDVRAVVDSQDLREKLAELCHSQWSGWMQYLFEKSLARGDNSTVIPREFSVRWLRQMNTPYAKLSEPEKNSDRAEADKFIQLLIPIVNALAAHPAQELRDNTNDLIVQRIRHILDLQGDADIVDVLKKRLGIDEH